jgi:hypothetical protein
VTTINDIRQEIERLTQRRAELFHQLSEGHDPALAAEHERVEDEIARLWEQHRIVRAQARFGDRDRIIRRARAEERLERAA